MSENGAYSSIASHLSCVIFLWIIHGSVIVNSMRGRENNSFPSSTFYSAFALSQVRARLLLQASGWLNPPGSRWFWLHHPDTQGSSLISLAAEQEYMCECSVISTCWRALQQSRPNEIRFKGDTVPATASMSHHFHMTTAMERERGPMRWRSKGWARENKSGDKFGAAVTAEGKKETSREAKQNWHSFPFVCRQTAEAERRGQWPSAQKYYLHENVSICNRVHCDSFFNVGKINFTFHIYEYTQIY